MRSLLTLPGVFGDSGVPQTVIGVTDAFPVPHTAEKSSHICFCQQAARGVSSGWFRYWRDNVDVRETQAAYHRPGSVVSAFFCAQIPKL